ncbi:MAG: hypothetical protein VXZ90_01370 [Planctomycetota bacterium]|nr:hypothetical protein [Planctomycetota bacterium]MEC8854207.1 hypothetical protein [Planctomycetota bacterium]
MQFFTLVVLHAAKLTEPPVVPGVLDVADSGPRTRQIRVESIQPAGLQTIEGVLPWGQIDPNDAWALAQPLLKDESPLTSLAFAQSILGWSDRWENATDVADRAIRMATVRDPSLRTRVNELKSEANRTRLRLRIGDSAARLGGQPTWPESPPWPPTPWQAGFGIGPDQDAAFGRLRLALGEIEALTLEKPPSDLLRAVDLKLSAFGIQRPISTTRIVVARAENDAAYRSAAQQLGRAPEPEGSWTPSGRHVCILMPPQTNPPTADEQAALVRLLVAARQHQDTSPRQAVRWWYAGTREVVTSALTGRSRIDGASRDQAVQKLRAQENTIRLNEPWSTTPGPESWQEDAVFGLLVEMLEALKRNLPELHALSKSSDTNAMLDFLGGDEAGFFRGAARYWQVHQ